MNRKIVSGTTLILAALSLTSCGLNAPNANGTEAHSDNVVHSTVEYEGGTLHCITLKSGYGGGLSCDYDRFWLENPEAGR
ncbi:hypothetical protein LG293_16685 (plasmid) [Citricoccus nitrophenolicus]